MSQSARLTDPEDIRRFITGGHALFTLVSIKTGDRITYKITRGDHAWFVNQLTGSDNESDYTYIGYMFGKQERLIFSPKTSHNKASAGLVWFLIRLNANDLPTDLIEFWHSGKCSRCGRTLTTPESIERGIGPVCMQRGA